MRVPLKPLKLISIAVIVLGLGALLVIMKARRAPRSMSEALRKMEQYQQRGRHDEAISLGKEWVAKHPQNGSNDQVFERIALLYLEKAKKDDRNRDTYVSEAIEYRDKMLPIALDDALGWYSMSALLDSALLSEDAGDLAASQRCVQYKTALRLLDRLEYSLHDKQERFSSAAGSTKDAFGYTFDDVQRVRKRSEAATSRIRGKQEAAGCQ